MQPRGQPYSQGRARAAQALPSLQQCISFVPEYFVHVYFKQEYDVRLVIHFLKLLWLFCVTEESSKLKIS